MGPIICRCIVTFGVTPVLKGAKPADLPVHEVYQVRVRRQPADGKGRSALTLLRRYSCDRPMPSASLVTVQESGPGTKRRFARCKTCPELRVKPTYRLHVRTSQFDPTETSAALIGMLSDAGFSLYQSGRLSR